METRREDIPDWDSFNYVNFIVAVEMEFGVKFKVADIESFPNVGSIVEENEEDPGLSRASDSPQAWGRSASKRMTVTDKPMLAERTFTKADQARFAAVSGDRNPVHLDAVLARRTQAGAPVVHGVHLLLWGLDALARTEPALPPMRRLKAQFKHFAAVDERVAVTATRTEASCILRFVAAGMTIAQLVVEFGAAIGAAEALSAEPVPAPAEARDLSFDAMTGMSGRLAFANPPDAIATMFPAASSWLDPRRVAALAATTLLVGMGVLGCIPFMPG